MQRLTKKFGDKIILPTIPMNIENKKDLDNYHKVRKDIEEKIIKLAEYEDIGLTPAEIKFLQESYHAVCKAHHINGH